MMNIMKELLLEWDKTGKNVTALCYYAFTLTAALFMCLTGLVRMYQLDFAPAAIYFVMCAGCVLLFLLVHRDVITRDASHLNFYAHCLVIGGFIFGLSALFFLEGGVTGGIPTLFIMAIACTPLFILETWEAILMLILEVAAYCANIYFALNYPESVVKDTSSSAGFLLPLFLVAVLLGLITMIFTYAYRHQQTKLDKAITEANAANEAKSTFLDNMSHEIRTPMNSILGMNEMILREEDRPEISEYALSIQRAGRALLGILNDILDFSKIQDNKMEISPVRYDLSSLLNDMVNIAAEQARKKSLNFEVNVDKTIPRILEGDEYHIRQVMLNILNNAVKFTERGAVSLEITHEKLDDKFILLKCSVSDTGIGIREEDMALIFQPFEHVQASRKFQSDGSGLGLTIVKNLLILMGSDLKVESVFQKGSKFSFELKQPVIKWEAIGDYKRAFSTAVAHKSRYHEAFQAPDAKVLVVDDTDVNLLVFSNLLKKTKIKIDTASSGVEMLQLVRMNHYDMVFLDHRMPGMDGVEAFHNMRSLTDSLNTFTPVIALTANAVIGARQFYIDHGFNDYLSKPVDTVRLEQILLEYLPADKIQPADPEDVKKLEERKAKEDKPKAQAQAQEPEIIEEPEEPASPYANIPGIDYNAAVTNCGIEETFVQALQIFYDTLDQKANDIERFEREKDIKNYTVLVHALKSSARLVGALQLSEDAKYLEACGDKNDIAEIEAKTPALLSQYRSYKKVLAEVFGNNDEEDMSLPEIPLDELKEFYVMLKDMAANFDLDNIDAMMEDIKNYRIPADEKERFKKIKDCVTAADWASLDELLK